METTIRIHFANNRKPQKKTTGWSATETELVNFQMRVPRDTTESPRSAKTQANSKGCA